MGRIKPYLTTVILFLWINGCIREDLLLPPVLDPLTSPELISGELIVLSGSNFDESTTKVLINDVLHTPVGQTTLTSVSFIPNVVSEATEATLQVTTKFGSSAKLNVTILPPIPKINKIIPSESGIGKPVKIFGSNFNGATAALFKSSSQTAFISVNIQKQIGDTLVVMIPQGLLTGAADVHVVTKSGQTIEPAPLTILAAPKIKSVQPNNGGPGTKVLLTGENFKYIDSVRFGGHLAELLAYNETLIETRVPETDVTDTIYVFTRGGKGKSPAKFVVSPAPIISSLDKYSGGVGIEVNIAGANFQGAFEVRFGNTPASSITVNNTGTSVKTIIPPGAESGKVSVTTPGGTAESDNVFNVKGSPLINSFAPTSGTVGTKVTITGFNLENITSGKIGLQPLKVVNTNETTCEVEILANSVTGKLSLTGTGGTAVTANNFVISGTPEITGINPASGAVGTIVTITGVNFPASPIVKFADNKQATVTSASSTQIICQVPSGAITGIINVHGATSAEFKVTSSPVITSILPMKGGVGKEVTITGNYLLGATVRFNNNITATKTTNTDTKLVVTVPASATTGKISLTTTAGAVSSSSDFEILLPPTITSFSPQSGIAGTTVSIFGTNLQHAPVVQFFSQSNALVKSVSPTQLLVEVPSGASTGKITVKTDAVDAAVASAANFVVAGKPAITAISPSGGTIQEKIAISGINFANLLAVTFDGVDVTSFISNSNTLIEVRVPSGLIATATRNINVSVKTSADVSGNATFTLHGTPVITKVSPDNNPSNWPFLLEGLNLHVVKRIKIDGKVPNYGTTGIDKQAYNYLTTKVPKEIFVSSNQTKTVTLYYTTDDTGFITTTYTVLKAPPPGVFAPPVIILPPPLPVNYTQTDLSAYWIDSSFVSKTGDSLRCYQFRTPKVDVTPQFGTFCQGARFYAIKDQDQPGFWTYGDVEYGNGGWNNGYVNHSFGSSVFEGRVYDEKGKILIMNDQFGRQLILVGDRSGNCLKAFGVTDTCN